MKKLLLLLSIGLLFGQCDSSQSSSGEQSSAENASKASSSEHELVRLLKENTLAMENEDLEKALSIVDKNWYQYEANKLFTQQMFNLYDLDYEVEKIEILEQSPTTAKVSFTHVVKKISGAEFFDQRSNTLLHFNKIDGEWKMIDREIVNTEFLNE